MTPASEIRARAREALGFRIFGSGWMYGVLACGIASIISSLASSIPWVGWAISLALTGIVNMGLCNYFKNVCELRENAHTNVEAMFDPLKNDAEGSIVTGLLITVFTALWTMLLIIPGIVKSFSYSMAFYIKLDNPELTSSQAITESRRMMDGHKFRLFCLNLSFIGWYFVGILACGVGVLWVEPYVQAARYEFYRDLKFADFGGTTMFFDNTSEGNKGE